MDKGIILTNTGGTQGATNPTAADVQQLEALLQEEALLFITTQGQQVFQLGKEYVQAILFKHAVEYVIIPPLTNPNDLNQIVERERFIQARSLAFQLVAKAELQRYEDFVKVSGDAEEFLKKVLESAGEAAAGMLVKYLITMLIV